MQEPLVLTFDVGTQSARAMLISPRGTVVAISQKKFQIPYYSDYPDWAEQDADYYWEKICEASLELKESSLELWDRIAAVTITTIRDTCVCIDKDAKPLRRAILWLDKRKTKVTKPIPYKKQAIFKTIKMDKAVDMQRESSACNWIMKNQPELWEKTDKFLMLSGYLTYCLCGKIVDSCANMIGHIPFDHKRRDWMKPQSLTRCIFDIEPEKLCRLVEPEELLGTITREASMASGIKENLPLIASGSDKGCETLGLSCITPEKAAISFGTTATIQFTTNRYIEPQRFIPPYLSIIKGRYSPEIQIFRGYWLVSWFKKEFAAKEVAEAIQKGIPPEELLNARLREIPPGCDGLILQPYFTPGITMPVASGSIIGFSDIHTRIHIYRAIIEGLNFALIDGLRLMEKRSGEKIKEIYLAGGGSQSDEICQITADMFGLPVHRIQTHEVSGLGSAMVAFISLGIFNNYEEAIKEMVQIVDTFEPNMETHRIYDVIYFEVFRNIYSHLLPLYKKNYRKEV